MLIVTECSSNLFTEQESGIKILGFWTASLGSAMTTSLSVCSSRSQLSCLKSIAYGCIFAFWKLQKLLMGEDCYFGHQEAIYVFRRGESLAEWTQQPAATAPWGMDGWWTWNTFLLGSFSLADHGSYASCCSTPPVPHGKDPTKEPNFGGEVLPLGD
jgi:hypothetical protein